MRPDYELGVPEGAGRGVPCFQGSREGSLSPGLSEPLTQLLTPRPALGWALWWVMLQKLSQVGPRPGLRALLAVTETQTVSLSVTRAGMGEKPRGGLQEEDTNDLGPQG